LLGRYSVCFGVFFSNRLHVRFSRLDKVVKYFLAERLFF
jgi:hypothetical protein